MPSFAKGVADERANVGALGDHLGDDVARAGERRLHVGDLFLGVDERRGLGRGIADRRLLQDALGERLEAALACDHGPGAPLRFVGQVEVLEPDLTQHDSIWARSSGVSLPCVLDLREDRMPALDELEQVGALLLDGADLHFVELRRSALCGSAR